MLAGLAGLTKDDCERKMNWEHVQEWTLEALFFSQVPDIGSQIAYRVIPRFLHENQSLSDIFLPRSAAILSPVKDWQH